MELKGKPYVLALVCFHITLEARHDIQVCWAAHKMNELVAQDNKLTRRGVYVKHTPSQATTWHRYLGVKPTPGAETTACVPLTKRAQEGANPSRQA